MAGAEHRVRIIFGVTKASFEHYIGAVTQVLMRLPPSESEAPAALSSPTGEAI